MPQLLTIKGYSDGQEQIQKSVDKQDKKFDEMAAEIEAGRFDYLMLKDIVKRFGDPVFSRNVEYDGQMTEQWLYRYAKDFKGEHGKVYCYFDGEGNLVGFEYVGSEGGF